MFGNNKIIKNILGTPRVRGGKKDWDFDGVTNKKDCQPRNTMRQDGKQKAMIIDGTTNQYLAIFPDEEQATKYLLQQQRELNQFFFNGIVVPVTCNV